MRTQGEGGVCQPRREASEETSPDGALAPDFQPPGLRGNARRLLSCPVRGPYGSSRWMVQACSAPTGMGPGIGGNTRVALVNVSHRCHHDSCLLDSPPALCATEVGTRLQDGVGTQARAFMATRSQWFPILREHAPSWPN